MQFGAFIVTHTVRQTEI